MKTRKPLMRVMALAMTFTLTATAADAPPLTFKFKTVNVPGAVETICVAVNNARVIVGVFLDSSDTVHGFILDGQKVTTLDDPNGTFTQAYGLNPNGAVSVVGTYVSNVTNNAVGFLYRNGQFTDVPGPAGAKASSANGINDSGDIVGYYTDSTNVVHGFLLHGKAYTTLNVPGATTSDAIDINDHRLIVLSWQDSSSAYHASLYNGKTYRAIDVPGAPQSLVGDINTAGDIIYSWLDSAGNSHGALRHAGKYFKFNHPRSVSTSPAGINDHRFIVGGFVPVNSQLFQGFKAAY